MNRPLFDVSRALGSDLQMSDRESRHFCLSSPEEGRLARAVSGSGSALGELLESIRKYLLLVAREELGGELRTKVSPSDVVQESFLEVRRDISRFQGTSEQEFVAWVRRILLHNVANVVRGFCQTRCRSLQREVPLYDAGRRDIADERSSRSPSQQAVRNEQLTLLHNAIATLPLHYQDVIFWRNYERLSFTEIGARLKRSEEAARKTVGPSS